MRRTFSMITACATALVLSAGAASAQTIGFKLGAGFPNMSIDDSGISSSSITAFAGGGHIRFGLGGRIGLQAELLSVTKGADVTDGADTDEYRFEYVEIPVLVHIPLTLGAVAPYVFGGGAVGLEVRCRVAPEGGSQTNCSDEGISTNSPDWGLVGGAGLAMAMGPGSVLLEGRYTYGLRNIFDAATAPDVRHRVPTVMIGYELPLVRSWY
ncbi:MAG TPA: porin family protein [Longimicrobiales bacterium]|nr:porin family protein [Longimicrobiales bacterium]